MALSPRLQAVLSLIPPQGTVADVGSDHGLLSVVLAERGQWVIAMDVSAPSLEKTRALAARRGVDGRVECRLSDGFSALTPGEANTAVLAGMGGLTIRSILEHGLPLARGVSALVLHPTNAGDSLRRWLRAKGFTVTGERLALENGRIQPIFSARSGAVGDQDNDELIGRLDLLAREPLFAEYLRQERDRCARILCGIYANGRGGPEQAREMAALKAHFEEVLSWLRQRETSCGCLTNGSLNPLP